MSSQEEVLILLRLRKQQSISRVASRAVMSTATAAVSQSCEYSLDYSESVPRLYRLNLIDDLSLYSG